MKYIVITSAGSHGIGPTEELALEQAQSNATSEEWTAQLYEIDPKYFTTAGVVKGLLDLKLSSFFDERESYWEDIIRDLANTKEFKRVRTGVASYELKELTH